LILGDLWSWWLQQMTDLVQMALPRRGVAPATALVVGQFGPGAVSLLIRSRRREQLIGRYDLDKPGLAALARELARRGRRVPLVVRFPPALLLEREVDLPLAVEPDIANALRYSIDTLTPFAADEVFWGWAVLLRDRVQKRLRVRLSLVRKTEAQPLIAALEQASATPKLLEFPLSRTETRTIGLGGAPWRGSRLRQSAPAVVGGCIAGAALALAVLPIALQARAVATIEAQIRSLQPRVAEVERLRRRLADDTVSVDVITREHGQVGDALQVIAIATEALPDNTYLTELSLRQRKLVLIGESGDAAKLIVMLSGEPMLHNTEFVAPVTRAPVGGRDMFSIETEVIP
jgi:general secretion pathway protein L